MNEPPAELRLSRLIDQARVDAYADAARDHNPIHIDEEFAAATPFGHRIAHGMLVLALVSELMTEAFGTRWAEGGSLKVRWRAPVVPPAQVSARCTLRGVADGVATYEVACDSEDGTALLAGTATVTLDEAHDHRD
jgi:3-hydroxybutyryl-CoA dehydratase